MATLYVTEPGSQVHKSNNTLVVKRGEEVLDKIPIIKIDQVVLVGRGVGVTTAALHALTRRGVDIVYLSGVGGYISRMIGKEHKHGRLRHQQAIRSTDQIFALTTARCVIRGKLHNQRTLVRRHAEGAAWAKRALGRMDAMLQRIESAQNLDELRGIEGQGAKEYFALFRELLRKPTGGKNWGFDRRAYYPPTDPINALLSFSYSLLLRDMTTACELIGLDPYLGFFHAIDYGRPSMALDLMEEFRPIVADSVVLEAVNRPYISLADFEQVDLSEKEQDRDLETKPLSTTKAVYLNDHGREIMITLYENRVNDEDLFQYQGQQTSYRNIFQLQSQAMARLILGKQDEYPPFTVR